MESTLHQLAVALQRAGIAHDQAVPPDAGARLCAELGISPKSLRNRRWELRRASEAGCEANQGPVSPKALRYRSDPIYAAKARAYSRLERRRNPAYHVFKNTRGNARKRGLAFELTREQVAEMLLPMRCSVTGLSLKPEWDGAGRNPWWPSLDQVDPCGGYVPDNVRVVSWAYNVMRGELEDATVRRFAAALHRGPRVRDTLAAAALQSWRNHQGKTCAAHLRALWKTSAQDRNISFDLETDWVRQQLSGGVCSVTGLSLSMANHSRAFRNPLVPSLDRVDSARGYEPDNVRLVCGWFNYARQDWTDELVRKVARALLRQSARTG
jgi:hypothetical protein